MRKILVIALLALSLASCANNPTAKIIGQIATGTLVNPVSATNMYEVNNLYAIADQSAIEYHGYCYARPYAVLMADPIAKPVCQNRRPTWRKIKQYKNTASIARSKASAFVRNNPTLDASTLISQASSAISALQSVTPAVPKP